MINHNKILYKLLDKTISVDFIGKNWRVNYTEGDLFELVAKLNDSTVKYPIIWLVSDYNVVRKKQEGKTVLENCKLFFISKGSLTDRYEKRFETTYNEVLYKSLSEFDKLIRKRKGISASDTDSFNVFPLNDMNKNEKAKEIPQLSTVNDIWDALLLNTEISISDDCFPELKIK